jgi:hypothetical protein
MTWLLPAAFVPLAGVFALILVWPRLRTPISLGRLALETLVIFLVTVAASAAAWALS